MRRAVSRVFAGTILLSVLGGVAWSFIAKPMRYISVGNGMGQSFDGESVNEFGAIAWFALLGIGLGLVVAVGSWWSRVHRGVGLLAAIVVSAALGSITMAAVGELIVRFRYPVVSDPKIDSIVSLAPRIFDGGFPVVLAVPPLVAAATIMVMAALSPFDDLGTGRPGLARRRVELSKSAGVED